MKFLGQQIFTFLVMFGFGVCLGVVLSIYRKVSRKIKPPWRGVIDVLSGFLAGIIGFLILLYANWGEFRFYVILAILCGVLIYYFIIRLVFLKK